MLDQSERKWRVLGGGREVNIRGGRDEWVKLGRTDKMSRGKLQYFPVCFHFQFQFLNLLSLIKRDRR